MPPRMIRTASAGSASEMAENDVAQPQALQNLGAVDMVGGRHAPPCNATSTTDRLPEGCIRLSL